VQPDLILFALNFQLNFSLSIRSHRGRPSTIIEREWHYDCERRTNLLRRVYVREKDSHDFSLLTSRFNMAASRDQKIF